jgi:hypothetical protein
MVFGTFAGMEPAGFSPREPGGYGSATYARGKV